MTNDTFDFDVFLSHDSGDNSGGLADQENEAVFVKRTGLGGRRR